MAESPPTADCVLAWIPIRSTIPSFHGLNGDAIPDFDSSAPERPPQWRFGAARDFAVAWNFQLKRFHMILKPRHVLQSPKTQNRPAAHAGFRPFGSIAAAAAPSNAMPISARKPPEQVPVASRKRP